MDYLKTEVTYVSDARQLLRFARARSSVGEEHMAVARAGQRAIAAGFAGWAFGRVLAVDRLRRTGEPAAALLSFTPQVAAGAWLAALLLRDRRASAVTAFAAGALTGLVLPRMVPRRQPELSGPALRVLSANLLVGNAATRSVIDLVKTMDADVLFVQELTDAADQALRRAGLDGLLPHSVTDLGMAGSRGNGIYARHPLAGCPGIVPAPGAGPVATLSLPSGQVRLVCVHLRAPRRPWSRRRPDGQTRWQDELTGLQAVAAPESQRPQRVPPGQVALAGQPSGPVILAGDFNSTLDHALFRRLLRGGYVDAARAAGHGLTPTWGPLTGGHAALLTLDHVLVSRPCAVLVTSAHRVPGTDHRAVFAAVRLTGPAERDGA